ncbi:MAG: transposase family protein [SAR324 cluster bacterium]|nr:transposase family protein [SAR324 cluster bacterium]
MAQIARQSLAYWPVAVHTPKNNANQCSLELEVLIVHLVKDDFEASFNMTAKHAASITGKKISANLVKQVRKRNGLEKARPILKKIGKVKSSYAHTLSVDVVREQGEHIFGFIQDKTKVSYHYQATAQTSDQAVVGLKKYIQRFGKPDAIRCDNGSEFRGEFKTFLISKGIKMMNPLPYNPGANGFIERYFWTLRKDLFRKLKKQGIELNQKVLDDYSYIWTYCRTVGKSRRTPAELAGLTIPVAFYDRFDIEKVTVQSWTFWHIKGIYGLLHAYVRENVLHFEEIKRRQKIA